jgi:hypothetical protein
VTRVREIEDENGGLTAEITGLEYNATVYGDTSITAYQPNTASGIPSFGGQVALPAPGTVAIVSQSPTANQPTFRISTTLPATSGPVDRILWYYTTTVSLDVSQAVYITDEVGPFSGGQTVFENIFALNSGTYYILARSQRSGSISAFSDLGQSPPPGPFTYSTRIDWNPTPAGASNGTINTSTFSSQLNILTTSTGAGFIPVVSAVSGFQPVYADADLTFSAAPNTLGIAGVGAGINFANTGTRITSPMALTSPLMFQSNITNSISYIGVQVNGTGATAGVSIFGQSDVNDSQTFRHGVTANTEVFFNSTRIGATRPFLPLNMYVAGRQVFSANTTTGLITIANGIQTTSLGYNTGTTTISHTLQRQNSQPAYFITGTMAVANGSGWNPTQEPTGGPAYLTYYNGAEWRAIGQPAVFGQFFSTGTSTISTVTNAQIIPLGNTGVSYGIFNTTATAITLNGPGVYNVMFSVQFTNSSSNAEYAYVWYRQNGVDIADSNSIFSVPGKHGARDGALIGTVDLYVTTSAAGEYVQLVWGADSTTISIPTVAAGTLPTRPRTPGVIVTVTKVK